MSDSVESGKDLSEGINQAQSSRRGLELSRTTHKKALDSLRKNEELFRSLVESTSDWIWEVDSEGLYTYCSPKVKDVLGYEPEEMIGKRPFDFMPLDEATEIEKSFFEEILPSRKSFSLLKNTNLHKDGHAVVLETSGVPFFDASGELVGYRGIDRDITERKRAEDALRQARDDWMNIFESISDMVLVLDREHRIVDVNRAAIKGVGLDKKKIIGQHCYEFFHCTDHPIEGCPHEQLFNLEHPEKIEVETEYLNGIYQITTTPVLDSYGKVEKTLHIAKDITGHKQAEESLKESEEKFRTLAEQSPNMIFINQGGQVVYANKRCEELMGYDREEFYSPDFDFLSLIVPECRDSIMKAFGEHMQGREVTPFEYAVVTKDGKRIESFYTTRLIKYKGENAILGTIMDITERKRIEDALRASEENYRLIFNAANDAIFIHDIETGAIIDVNQKMSEMFGYTTEEVKSINVGDISSGEEPYTQEEAMRWMQLTVKEGPQIFEWRGKHKSGSLFWIEVSLKRTTLGGQDRILAVVRNITERKLAEEALRDSEEKFRRLVEDTLQGVTIVQDGRVIFANPSAQRLINYTLEELCELSEEEGMELIHPEDREMVLNHMQARLSGERIQETVVYRVIQKGGEVRWAEGTTSVTEYKGKPTVQIYNTDITERKLAEEQLRQTRMELEHASRLITAGELTTGLAHELNQPLCAVTNYADACSILLNAKVINIMKVRDVIKAISKQANRAGDIIKHMRKLVRKHEPTRTKVHINDIIQEVLKLEAAEANQQNVDIKVRLAKDLPEVWLGVIEIEQVLMNLINNAFEAMVEVPIKKRKLEIQTSLTEDENILISIEDSGKGISEEEIEKVFDSFFTTKTNGLGIGLPLSRSIVEFHGGRMWVKPNGRKGAIFEFTLPLKGERNGQD
ncbi:MAG: PAS domain S-box protein [Planctomycetota bacterium]|jgi:PAS domain S-box-containing protein